MLAPSTHLLTRFCFILLRRQGIGLPAVAASGTIAANTLATVRAQNKLMKELKAQGALQ
jgi:hypothetical protein